MMTNEEHVSISQRDYCNVVHAALGPVTYAALGAALLPMLDHESCNVHEAALVGLASSAPSILIALGLRWMPPCHSLLQRGMDFLGSTQHILYAALYGATTGLGALLQAVPPSFSTTRVMAAAEVGVAVSTLAVGCAVLLKNLPRHYRILKAQCCQNEEDTVRVEIIDPEYKIVFGKSNSQSPSSQASQAGLFADDYSYQAATAPNF